VAAISVSYIESLKKKLNILRDIYKNTLDQFEALEKKDLNLLGKLLSDRQNRIEELRQIMNCPKDFKMGEKSEEIEKLERDIDHLFHVIIDSSITNLRIAEKQKNEIGEAIKNLKMGRYAIFSGYFKKMPQRYGYFIDKKIGK